MQQPPTMEQIFALGVATASAALSENAGARLTLRSFRIRPAADFPDVAESDHVDVVAGVAQRFSGVLRGTSVFSMDPEGALAWSRSVTDPGSAPDDVISTFLELCSRVVVDVVGAAAQAMYRSEVAFDAASLRESSRVAIVIGTHAPSDTAVVTLGFDVEFDGAVHGAHIDLLLEPKPLAGHWVGADAE
jgi:hypothetical protein